MGNTLHIHKKHIIEYGGDGLNWCVWETERLLKDKGCYICGSLNDDCIGDWEIDCGEFKDAVEKIKKMPADELRKYFPRYRKEDSDEKLKNDIVKLFQTFIDTGDTNTGYYHSSCF